MFFDDYLLKDNVLKDVWRAGHNQPENAEEQVSLPINCDKLSQWLDNESTDPRRRISLRTSSVMIAGAARLAKKQLQQLVEDAAELDKNIVMRNRVNSATPPEESSNTSISETPEEMMRQPEHHSESFESHKTYIIPAALDDSHSSRSSDTTIRILKRQSNATVSYKTNPKRQLTKSDESNDSVLGAGVNRNTDKSLDSVNNSARSYDIRRSIESITDTLKTSDINASQQSVILASTKPTDASKVRRNKKVAKPIMERKNQATQTDSFYPGRNERDDNSSFPENLPFGYLLVFDSPRSIVPSRIVLSSLRSVNQ